MAQRQPLSPRRAIPILDFKDWGDRFWAKVTFSESSDCWVWTASKNPAGYPLFYVKGERLMVAHRFLYTQLIEIVPTEIDLDHLCLNKSCVNPQHLEPVTHQENSLRGNGVGVCKRGHSMVGSNIHYRPSGRRRCLACTKAYQKEYDMRKREERYCVTVS